MGKSVYLELKLEEEGAAFLGDWFGKGDKEIVLPVRCFRTNSLLQIPTINNINFL